MDEFDYLNGTLSEWIQNVLGVQDIFAPRTELQWIEEEYLPRFEAAIYRNQASRALGAAYGLEDDLILQNSEPKV